MSVNRYDKPSDSNIQNTFTPIPWDQMMQAGQMMAQQYEQGANALQKVYDDTYNIKYIPGSKDEQYVKQNVIPAAKEIFTKYISQDLGNPIVRRQAIMDLNSRIDKNKIGKIQESHAGWSENQKWRQKLQAEGQYADYLDTPDTGYDTDMHGVYSKLTPAKQDFRKEAETYFNNLEPDSYISNGEVRLYIDPKKLQTTAKGNVQSFLDSTAGRQKLIEYRKRTGDNESSPESVAYNYLMEVGKEKLMNRHAGFVPEHMTRGRDDDSSLVFGAPEALAMEDVPGTNLKSTNFAYNAKTTFDTKGGSAAGLMGGTTVHNIRKGWDDSLLQRDDVKKIVALLPKEYRDKYNVVSNKTTADHLKKTDPEGYNLIMKNLYGKLGDVYKGVDEHLKKGSYFMPINNTKVRDEMTKNLLGSNNLKQFGAALAPNRKFYDLSTNKVYTGEDFIKEVIAPAIKKAEELGIDPRVDVSGLLHGDNPFSHPALTNDPSFRKGLPIAIGGKNIIMSGPPSSKYDMVADQTYHQMKNLKNTEIEDSFGNRTIKELYDGKNYTFKDEGGNIISSSPDFDNAYNDAYKSLISNTQ